MTTTDQKTQKSNNPFQGYTSLFDTEQQGIDQFLITLGRLCLCAQFAPDEDMEAKQQMFAEALNIYDSVLDYRRTL